MLTVVHEKEKGVSSMTLLSCLVFVQKNLLKNFFKNLKNLKKIKTTAIASMGS